MDHLLTHSGLICPVVSLKVFLDSWSHLVYDVLIVIDVCCWDFINMFNPFAFMFWYFIPCRFYF